MKTSPCGTRASYIAGCRCPRCGDAHYRYQKRSRLRLLTEGPQAVEAAAVLERLSWWTDRGVSVSAVSDAAKLGEGTLRELVLGERDVCLRSTRNAVLSVTWDDIPDRALCSAEMTRRRVFSLMASGYTLKWISDNADGLPLSGRWRAQKKVYVSTARAVAHLSATVPAIGPSKMSAGKARAKGHLPLMGWDDPGDPAMPAGWAPEEPSPVPVDEIVRQYLAGDFSVPVPSKPSTYRTAVCRAWHEEGRLLADLGRATGWAVHRYFKIRDHRDEVA